MHLKLAKVLTQSAGVWKTDVWHRIIKKCCKIFNYNWKFRHHVALSKKNILPKKIHFESGFVLNCILFHGFLHITAFSDVFIEKILPASLRETFVLDTLFSLREVIVNFSCFSLTFFTSPNCEKFNKTEFVFFFIAVFCLL